MKTATIESEYPEIMDAAERGTVPPDDSFPDPDFPIENTGGPSDGTSQAHTGSVPPPAR